jgi:hypothetical protein
MPYVARQAAESVTGVGQVMDGSLTIATAMYVITIRQTISFTRKSHVQGPPTFNGAIRILSGERNLLRDRVMKLRLEDGRSVVFSVRRGDTAQASYDIRVIQLPAKN